MKTSRKILLILLGLVLVMASLWGGSWLLYINPDQYNFASFSTACILFILGLACIIAVISDKI